MRSCLKMTRMRCLVFVLAVAGAQSIALVQTTQTSEPGTATESVAALMNEDGTLNLHTGFRGTLSLEGWTMVTDASGQPRLVRASGVSKAGPGSPNSSAEGIWDNRFCFPGVDGEVYSIVVHGGEVYFGGAFTSAGGTPSRNIAKWDGQNWSALGLGVDGPVYAIAV